MSNKSYLQYDNDYTTSKCSVVLSYLDPFGTLVSIVENNVPPACLRDIKLLIKKYQKYENS